MKTRILIIVGALILVGFAELTFAEESHTFEIDGYDIITNAPNIDAIHMDWDSEHLPEFSVNFTEPFTGQFQMQIPKNMPRTMNLDFETTLMMDVSSLSGEEQEKNWIEHIVEKDFKMIDDRVSETESLCYYIVTVELSETDYFKVVTGSVASGRWEPVIIENEECNTLYDESTFQPGSVFPRHGFHLWTVPPLKQFQSEILIDDIQCKNDLVLLQKYDGSPACVTESTKLKLADRGWIPAVPANLILHDAQSWGYIKDVAILGNGYAGITMSYPTNEAYHELYPDNDNFIVGNCDVQDDSASLSVLYLNDIDSDANTITFTKKDKIFDGMSCDDAFWNEMTKNGYCGPSPHLMSQRETLVSSITDAQNMVDFVLHAPTYLPTGYDVQKIRADDDRKHATLFISPFSVTSETDMCAFAWSDGGIYLSYASLPEGAPRFSNDPDRERITINENRGYVKYREIGDRAGTPIPQRSEITWHMPEGNLVLNMYSSLSAEELIKIAESIG